MVVKIDSWVTRVVGVLVVFGLFVWGHHHHGEDVSDGGGTELMSPLCCSLVPYGCLHHCAGAWGHDSGPLLLVGSFEMWVGWGMGPDSGALMLLLPLLSARP